MLRVIFLPYSATITKYHRLRWPINNRDVFHTVAEAEKSKIKVSADLVSGEDQPPVSQMAAFSGVLTW